jgi:hypothetical protein
VIEQVRPVLAEAIALYAGTPEEAPLREAARRLDGPLRVAIAGRLKAGKSTLLNALVGEPLAATDATECTRVVTWYEDGPTTRVWAHPLTGSPTQLRFERSDGATRLELGPFRPEDLRRIVVETSSARLRRLTLVDTPGLGSSSVEVSARSTEFLTGDERPDAVLYLMRHVHTTDVGALQAFEQLSPDGAASGDEGVAVTTTVGVLSRADELAGGRPDGLATAERIAARYRQDHAVRALVQTVVPVSGLLGQAAVGLREADYAAFARLAATPDSVLLSADRFVERPIAGLPEEVLPTGQRRDLLARFGLGGVRLAVALVRGGQAPDATALARRLQTESGLDRVREVLADRFVARAELLKAQRALSLVETIATRSPRSGSESLLERRGAVVAGAHELAELELLHELRSGGVTVEDGELLADVEALLGVDGRSARQRLRLAPDTPDAEVSAEVLKALRRWRRMSENPVASADRRRVARVLRRSCEGLLTIRAS